MLLDSFIISDMYPESTKDNCDDISAEKLSELVFKIQYDMFFDVDMFHRGTYRVNLSTMSIENWEALRYLYILGNADLYANRSIAKNGINPGAYLNRADNFLLLIHFNENKIQPFLDHYCKKIINLQICNTKLLTLSLGMLTDLEKISIYKNSSLTNIHGLDKLSSLTDLRISLCNNLTTLPGLANLIHLTSLEIRGCNSLSELLGLERLSTLRSLNLSSCIGLTTLHGLEGLTNLTNLNLAYCENISELPGLGNLSSLTSLDISFCNSLTDLTVFKKLPNLTRLDMQSCGKLTNLTKWDNFPNLMQLNLSGNTHLTTLIGLESLSRLTTLNLFGCTGLVTLSGLDSLTYLKCLDLSFCLCLTELAGLERLTNLNSLYLYRCTSLKTLNLEGCKNLTTLQGLTTLYQLTRLNLSGCKMLSQIVFFEARYNYIETRLRLNFQLADLDVSGCKKLTALDLAGLRNLTTLHGLDTLTCLTELSCSYSSIQFPQGFQFPPNIKRLDLSHTPICTIPDGIKELKSLEILDLRNLQLKDLPNWFPEIAVQFITKEDQSAHGKKVILYDTTVESMDMSIFNRPYKMIVKWFEERKKGRTELLNEVKIIFLGDGEAGKSHTIARLLNDGKKLERNDRKATPGIAIDDQIYDIDGRQIQVHFWDFGGQEILHSMHRMFLTRRTLYVILLNARDNTQDDRARYWLHNIKSFAPDAPVMLVLNKIDQNQNASINESGLRSLYPGLTEVVRMSALDDSQEKFNATFTAAMKRQICAFKVLESPFTSAWQRLKDKLHGMTEHYIRSPEYVNYCAECGVEESEETRKALLEWFKDLGVCFCYSESSMLEDYVVLQPQWITNAIYILLYNRINGNKNGIVSHTDIFRMLKRPDTLADKVNRVLPDVFYSVDEVQYVLNVVRQFRLSYPVDSEKEFFPMLCNRNEPTIVKDFVGNSDVLEFRMVYEYLPNNVVHRLMVDMYRDLQIDNVWLTGAHFIQGYSNLSAVVKSDGNMLTIYVRRGTEYPAKVYLDTIKDHLDRISQEMSLEVKERQITYYEGDLFDVFDYEELIGSQNSGIPSVYSKRMKKTIPIKKILQQSGHQAGEDREKLIQDILNTCRRMQANKLYWHSSEDDRNTYIRDALELMNYIAKDQTLVGTGAGGKHPGEPDIEIRKFPTVPWTIFEGLNLCGTSPSEVKKWNCHLKKLLDNYNPIGLSFLILTNYVPCHKDKFVSISNYFVSHIKTYSPDTYAVRGTTEVNTVFDHIDETNFLRMVKCVYDCGGSFTTVYHIFLRLGTEQ